MMEDTNIDGFTRQVMDDSSIEIANPAFNDMVMRKIVAQSAKRYKTIKTLSICLIFAGVLFFSFLLIFSLQSQVKNISAPLNSLSNGMFASFQKAGEWILGKEYFILPIVVILLIKRIIDARLKYSQKNGSTI